MEFVNRKKEIAYLKEAEQLAQKKLFSIAIYGLRRVGKTRLVLEFIQNRHLYFFINKNKNSKQLLKEYENELKKKNLLTPLETIPNFDIFFEILLKRFKGIVVFDEFQNFFYVDKSIFGILQKNLDLEESNKGLLFIFTGSVIGLLKKTFQDIKEPLYDRIKRSFHLKPLEVVDAMSLMGRLKIVDFESKIMLYSVFGGFPKYYVKIEDEDLFGAGFYDILTDFFLKREALLEDEVEKILSLEFGKRYGIYYNILEAVAQGENTLSKISSFLRVKETSITRQIGELVNYFEILQQEFPLIGKRGIYYINHPLMNFWFTFFYKENSAYRRRDPLFLEKVIRKIPAYVGKRFEFFCRELVVHKLINIGFPPHLVCRQWGKIQGKPAGENSYEIDICAVNENTLQVLFGECKWKDKVDAKKVLQELQKKAQYVDWNKGKREEFYVIFAKSFARKIKEKNVLLFDLKDLQKELAR